ncbi:hypothetical protein OV450_6062 [Actinobacteria bacterium OV450]|nr:hypothetical protein OV450_6062 [Actinobacteria bacterium OV450]
MGEGTMSSEDRVERWQALLSGSDSTGVRGQALRRSGGGDLLTGGWVHAAARAEQGLELTELERSILAPLEGVLGEEEVHAVGRVYRKQRAEGGPVALVPQSVTSRSLDEGFDQEAYRAALHELLPQIMAMPNVSVADRARLADGDGYDSPEFTAAMAASGFGVTGFAGNDDGDRYAAAEAVPPFAAHLHWLKFACHEPVGDQGGGRDEIYWTASSVATNYKHSTRTAETGEVVRGEFPARGDHATGNPYFFEKTITGCGSVAISLWEADQSNAEWYDKLGQALRAASDMLEHIPDYAGLIPTPSLYGHMVTAVNFLATFWEAFRNKDDHVLTRGLVFGPADLSFVYNTPGREMRMPFDARSTGMGNFTLTVEYSGEAPTLPLPPPVPQDLWLRFNSTTDVRTWNSVTPPYLGATPFKPGLAVFDNKLYCAFFDRRTWETQYASFDGTLWTSLAPMPKATFNNLSPSLAVFNDKLYCATYNGALQHASFDGSTWTPFAMKEFGLIPPGGTQGCSLAVFNGQLYCFFNGGERDSGHSYGYYSVFDGSTWSRATAVPGSWGHWTPGAAVFNNKIHYLAHASYDGSALRHTSFDGSSWSDPLDFTDAAGSSQPALAVFNDKLYCVIRGGPGWLRVASFDGRSWSPFTENYSSRSNAAPALAVFNDALYCLHRGYLEYPTSGENPPQSEALTAPE